MKVLLIFPPWTEIYGTYRPAARLGVLYPPLGLAYLSAALRAAGHQTMIVDMEANNVSFEALLRQTEVFCPELIGISSVSPVYNQAKEVAQSIRRRFPTPLVLGGPHATIVEEEALRECDAFDYAVLGEGEYTLVELAGFLARKISVQGGAEEESQQCRADVGCIGDIKGLVYRDGEDLVKTEKRPMAMDLDVIALPDRTFFKKGNYLWSVPGKGTVPFTTVMTTRGCPFNCIFCSQDKMFGRRVRFRGLSSVLEEIELILHARGAEHLVFIDDTLTIKRERTVEMCEMLLSRGIKITWEGWTRANLVDKELLHLMRKAGLVRLSFGIESGDPEVLKAARKGVSREEVEEGYRIAKEAGIETRGSIVIGLPYETKQSVETTFQFVSSLKHLDQVYVNIAMPYPGTELRDMAIRGEGGLRLLTADVSELRRHGNAVMEVNDLTKGDLIRLQRFGLRRFYLTWRRVRYNLGRAGFIAGFRNAWAFLVTVILPRARRETDGPRGGAKRNG